MLETKETGVAKYKVLKLLVKGMDGWYFGLESFRLTGVGGRNLENKCVHCESTVQLQAIHRGKLKDDVFGLNPCDCLKKGSNTKCHLPTTEHLHMRLNETLRFYNCSDKISWDVWQC